MVDIKTKNNFDKTSKFFDNCLSTVSKTKLDEYGKLGVTLLSEATPKKTGLTASSWSYKINKSHRGYEILFENSNIVKGEKIALLIQYGHGTSTGGFVAGRDYINPVLTTLLQTIENDLRKELFK